MRLDLFLISFLTLFLELTCIRWFPSHVLFLTFFTNTVLLASILGISVGCLAANRKSNLLMWTPLILMIGARQRASRRMAAADLGEHHRRRQPGVAANGVLRRRVPGARSVELRDPDRSDLRLLLPRHRAGDDGAGPAARARARADSQSPRGLHASTSSAASPASSCSRRARSSSCRRRGGSRWCMAGFVVVPRAATIGGAASRSRSGRRWCWCCRWRRTARGPRSAAAVVAVLPHRLSPAPSG